MKCGKCGFNIMDLRLKKCPNCGERIIDTIYTHIENTNINNRNRLLNNNRLNKPTTGQKNIDPNKPIGYNPFKIK